MNKPEDFLSSSDIERLVEGFKDDVIPNSDYVTPEQWANEMMDDIAEHAEVGEEYSHEEKVNRAREMMAYWNGVLDGLNGLVA